MMSMLNNVGYSSEINDTLFAAHKMTVTTQPFSSTFWIPETNLATLGCTEQYQLCSMDKCTKLGGIYQLAEEIATNTPSLNQIQNATANILWTSMFFSQMYWQYYLLNMAMLLASDRIASSMIQWSIANSGLNQSQPTNLYYYYSSPLSDNQWKQEAEQVQNMALATIQQLLLGHAAQPDYILRPGVHSSSYVIAPDTPAGQQLCAQQMFRSSSSMSFNVFGLVFLLLIGVLIACLGSAIPYLVAKRQLRSNNEDSFYRLAEWKLDDVLQLLRAALTKQNGVNWNNKGGSVPVTVKYAQEMKGIQ
jgi:hypothetical protein